VTARVVRPGELWRHIDTRIRRAIAQDAPVGTHYAHGSACACAVCSDVGVRRRLEAIVLRAEAETLQELACDPADAEDAARAMLDPHSWSSS
jgi:hypothetical protein